MKPITNNGLLDSLSVDSECIGESSKFPNPELYKFKFLNLKAANKD